MKQLSIANDVAVDTDIRALLAKLGIEFWTRIPRAAGRGPRTGAREDDHVWPGYNAMIVACVSDHHAETIMQALQEFRDGPGRKTGIFAWLSPVEAALTPPKEPT